MLNEIQPTQAESSFPIVYQLYKHQGWISRIRTYQRWYAGTPFEVVERHVPKSGTILDLGCGWGMFSSLLALKSPERRVIGIDLDQVKVERARRASSEISNLEFHCKHLKDVVAPQCKAIVFYDVLHHLNDRLVEQLLEESFEKLIPGGRLILKENDTEPFLKARIADLWEFVALGFSITESEKIHFRSRSEWKTLLELKGFKVIHNEHLKTWHGFWVPHSLIIAEKPDRNLLS